MIFHPLVQRRWTRTEPGAASFLHVSNVDGRCPNTWAMLGYFSQELEQWEHEPALILDAAVACRAHTQSSTMLAPDLEF